MVIAIIAILVALLLPAVQQVREAARKSQCQDHLHNIAIAVMSYEGSFKVLPPLLIADYHTYCDNAGGTLIHGHVNPATPVQFAPNWAWSALMLPYIEQKPAYDTLQVATLRGQQSYDLAFGGTPDLAKQAVFTTPISLLVCPSDNMPEGGKIKNGDRRCRPAVGTGAATNSIGSNYVAVNRGDINQSNPGWVKSASWAPSGAFRIDTSTRIAQVTDGVSNCLFFGERAYQYANKATLGAKTNAFAGLALIAKGAEPGLAGPNGCGAFNCGLTDAGGIAGGRQINASTNAHAQGGFSSAHSGGAQFAIGDGKVTFVSENIDLTMLRNLGRISDGVPVRVP